MEGKEQWPDCGLHLLWWIIGGLWAFPPPTPTDLHPFFPPSQWAIRVCGRLVLNPMGGLLSRGACGIVGGWGNRAKKNF